MEYTKSLKSEGNRGFKYNYLLIFYVKNQSFFGKTISCIWNFSELTYFLSYINAEDRRQHYICVVIN